jgi:hypothetical protein
VQGCCGRGGETVGEVMVAGMEVAARCLVFVCLSNGGGGAAARCRRGAAPWRAPVVQERGGAVLPAMGARRGRSRPSWSRVGEGGRGLPWVARGEGGVAWGPRPKEEDGGEKEK